MYCTVNVPRRRRGQNSSQTAKGTIDAVRILARICPDAFIASVLNRNGLRTGRGNYWTRERVTSLRSHHGIPAYSADQRALEGWMNLTETARLVGVNPRTLRLAVERGEVDAEHPLPDGPWVFNRSTMETGAVAGLTARARTRHPRPAIPARGQGVLDLSTT